jgi:hypothetical protein
MMKMMILAPRRVELEHAALRRYVTEVHGPLVRSVPEVAADIRHYHYNFPLAGARDEAFGHPLASELDIVTQGWFDSREAQLRNMREPRYLEIIRPDEGRFANEAGALMHYTREQVIRVGSSTRLKVFYFRRRRPTLTRAAFQRAWAEAYPAALGAELASCPHIARYVQNQVLEESAHPEGESLRYYDVIDEFSLQQLAGFAQFGCDTARSAQVRAIEGELLEGERTRAFIAETVYNIP